jgi:hypothetical protein
MKRKKRRKKKTSGSKFLGLFAIFLLLPGASAEKRKQAEPYGLVAGTVFREPGFALAGAEVTLVADPESGVAPAGLKKQKASTGARGEFAFRVPVAAMRYALHAQARGYTSQDKRTSIEGEQRVEVTFLLARESK